MASAGDLTVAPADIMQRLACRTARRQPPKSICTLADAGVIQSKYNQTRSVVVEQATPQSIGVMLSLRTSTKTVAQRQVESKRGVVFWRSESLEIRALAGECILRPAITHRVSAPFASQLSSADDATRTWHLVHCVLAGDRPRACASHLLRHAAILRCARCNSQRSEWCSTSLV
jgi:hypothetical protein